MNPIPIFKDSPNLKDYIVKGKQFYFINNGVHTRTDATSKLKKYISSMIYGQDFEKCFIEIIKNDKVCRLFVKFQSMLGSHYIADINRSEV